MKHTPDMQRVIERMKPGVLSLHGFLGADRRSLEEILDADASTVAGLATTHELIAAGLAEVLEKAKAGLGGGVRINKGLEASYFEVMGRIPCPWGDGSFQKGEVTLTETATADTLVFTPLSLHMIAVHGFYEGLGSRYRIEPANIHCILRMRGPDTP